MEGWTWGSGGKFWKIFNNHFFDGKHVFNPLSAKFIKWSNTLKQIVGKLPTICLSVFDHFSGLAFKGLINEEEIFLFYLVHCQSIKNTLHPSGFLYALTMLLANFKSAFSP